MSVVRFPSTVNFVLGKRNHKSHIIHIHDVSMDMSRMHTTEKRFGCKHIKYIGYGHLTGPIHAVFYLKWFKLYNEYSFTDTQVSDAWTSILLIS